MDTTKKILDRLEKEDLLNEPYLFLLREHIIHNPEKALELLLEVFIRLNIERKHLINRLLKISENSVNPIFLSEEKKCEK